MEFHDKQHVTFKRTAEGYLVAQAPVARTGIQIYVRADFPELMEQGGDPDDYVRVYRPESEVFNEESLATYAHRPITLGHHGMVNADNWKDYAVGQTGGEVMRDGDKISIPMMVMDAAAIAAVDSKLTRELSMGYEADVIFGDGVTPDGEAYDAVQKGLRMNHLAIVAKARGGSELKIGDNKGAHNMADQAIKTRTIVVDGLPIECTDASAAVIEKLQGQIADAEAAATEAETQMAQRDARITELESEQLTDADLDAKVAERAELVTSAAKLADGLETAGKTEAEIRKAAVVAKLGDAKVEGKSDAYIAAMFDALLDMEPAKRESQDSFAAVVKDGKPAKQPGAWGKNVFKNAGVKMKKEA